MKIHLVTAEHFRDAGLIQKAFATHDAATAEAIALVSQMLKDSPVEALTEVYAASGIAAPTPETWAGVLYALQDYHGAAHCYVEITELEVAGSAFIDSALKIASDVAKAGTDDEGDMIVYADETGSVALLDAARAVESDVDAYLARFPADHRTTADRAYQDGFVDGVESDHTAARGVKLCSDCGNDFWGECPDQPRSDWRYQVANGDTSLGYWEWAAARIESEKLAD